MPYASQWQALLIGGGRFLTAARDIGSSHQWHSASLFRRMPPRAAFFHPAQRLRQHDAQQRHIGSSASNSGRPTDLGYQKSLIIPPIEPGAATFCKHIPVICQAPNPAPNPRLSSSR
jgi:hypothetical protein